ncbi:calmodulin-binding protein 60 A-like [Lycium ferocissimum]|uniref:calmodulin-binding protein 60 A-like n=1 Tax=Lycium ferocissimum TaxID=112874 RepID=UPI002815A5E8|nr:calmodulin-binding protein 60 A-like [Lycium ferocissimum]
MGLSPSYSGPTWSSFHKTRKLPKLKSVMVVFQVLRLLKSIRRLCIDPAGVEPKVDEISTGPRKEQENSNPCDQCGSRHLKLKFSSNINGTVYTGLPVGGDRGNTLNLDLVDCRTENIVKSEPEASAEVEIVVLEKDFASCTGDKSLIRGDPHVRLKDGTVSVSHISFKHTKNPMRKRELRLGARAVHPYDIGTRIKEAATEPFFVMDRRSMPKSKRPLNLDDQVWKLQTIGNDGTYHDRLMKENIKTVRDLLIQYFLNRDNLLKIIGRHMCVKKLDAAVNQAKSKLDLKRYVYPSAHSQESVPVVFSDVGELLGIYQEGQFLSVEKLTGPHKAYAMELVKTAFQDGQNSKVLDDDTIKLFCSSYSSNVVGPMEAVALDGSNGFSSEAYYPAETLQQQVSNANYMPGTIIINNYDSTSQINSLETLVGEVPGPLLYDNSIYYPLPESIWNF